MVMSMDSLSYTAARSALAQTMDNVCDDQAPVAITRQGRSTVVMMSLEDYEAFEETAYLLRSPRNRDRLAKAVDALGRVVIR